jgi:hypothetical protein
MQPEETPGQTPEPEARPYVEPDPTDEADTAIDAGEEMPESQPPEEEDDVSDLTAPQLRSIELATRGVGHVQIAKMLRISRHQIFGLWLPSKSAGGKMSHLMSHVGHFGTFWDIFGHFGTWEMALSCCAPFVALQKRRFEVKMSHIGGWCGTFGTFSVGSRYWSNVCRVIRRRQTV